MTENNKDTKSHADKHHHRNIIIVVAFILFVECIVLVSAISQSGKKRFLQITDAKDQVIYEINGEHLSEFDKYYFENTFGPLDKYGKNLTTKEIPFPFRAWITAAAGLPLFLILLSAFAVKAYKSLFISSGPEQIEAASDPDPQKGFYGYLNLLERLNIFVIGFILLLTVFLYWIIPNLFTYISKTTIDFIISYKWFFMGVSGFVAGMIIWITYLRYLLARKGMEIQKEIALKQIELDLSEKKFLLSSREIKLIEPVDSKSVSPD